MSKQKEPLVDPAMLFRFSVPCFKSPRKWAADGVKLPPKFQVPAFGELGGRFSYADFRIAYSDAGLFVDVHVRGKKESLWCRENRIEDSDGVLLWIDTRDTHTIHRASRFCHQFMFMPQGAGRGFEQPLAKMVEINRARENPVAVRSEQLSVVSRIQADGYQLSAFIAADCLTGFDVTDHVRLGFNYAVIDRELGWQTFSLGPEYPIREDPSLWGTLELQP